MEGKEGRTIGNEGRGEGIGKGGERGKLGE